jgi:SagB-type dehydrogenase family enzyme
MVDAREYHDRTDQTRERLASVELSLDPATRPRLYKQYRGPQREPLDAVRPPQGAALAAVATARADPLGGEPPGPGPGHGPPTPDREALATLCYEAGGVVEAVNRDGETVRYRAASCTGKLYHVELYAVCGDLDGLAAGVYHFDPDGFALDTLREGDHRGDLAAAAGHPGVAGAPVTFVATSAWERNAWKYRDRAFRHAFWDAGTVLANLLGTAHATDRRAEVVAGFDDDRVVDLLGLDPDEEAPLALAPVGRGDPVPEPAGVDPVDPATVPYSDDPEAYPLVADAWRAGRLESAAVEDWRAACRAFDASRAAGDGERVPLEPVDDETASARPLSNAVRRRGSCRSYADRPLSRRKLGTVLDRATRGVPGDWNGGSAAGLALNDVYALVSNVQGVPAGAYQFHPDAAALERVGDSDSDTQTTLALEQAWAGDAHVNVYCMADVDAVVESLGNRGYRLAQLEAGLTLGRLYLATYAHRELGGTGLTFFDREVTDQLSPRAAGQRPTTLFALGVAD